MKISNACRRALAAVNLLILSVAHATQGPGIGDPIPEVKATAVPEPSPLFLLAGAMAVLLLLMRKGGPRSR
ncbi:PEP-CTERM sorting domain-containing protein [Luteolibacter flavescens]|uniref:PEP-CTERM sorting domain-containing protein n=1 Tax=Luteolibacter flavescens TaxID=1859460 RepID=A0ABT3FV81_9BACT|nr:PEP-CTERM sorting domain-containing protein [Luteolibacter flavescens]MCW1887508.1 PEP-CTERM sorting domain-containing protein [Luteolibacter flavescens]